jgi:hypothetical protein
LPNLGFRSLDHPSWATFVVPAAEKRDHGPGRVLESGECRINGMGIKSFVKRALRAAGYEIRKSSASHSTWVPPGHFYSPIVDVDEVRRDKGRIFDRQRDLAGIILNEVEQIRLVEEFGQFYPELPFEKSQSDKNLYYYDNPYYSYGDAIILACMLRQFKPKRFIEFGSGFSSCAVLDINRLFFRHKIICTFIDPNPERLQTLVSKYSTPINIIKSRAQDIDLSDVSNLEHNDIVLIDSTHVTKAGSDVNFHLFDLLPRLSPGVLVHFHDIFYPFEYPEEWFFHENRSFNENYILRAFLSGNSDYEIVFFNDFMRLKHLELVTKVMPLFQQNPGGSLWIRKLQ